MSNSELFINIIYPASVALGTGLIIFISSHIYNKLKKDRKKEIQNTDTKELLSDILLFEANSNARYFIEVDTPNSYLVLGVLLVNNSKETIIIRDIKISMGGCIGSLTQEHKIKLLYHGGKEQSYTIGNKINYPIALTPTVPNNFALTFLFTDPSVSIGKLVLEIDTSKGELLMPISIEIKE